MDNIIGKNILEYRDNLGMTQEELSGALGVYSMQIAKWENGEDTPSDEQLAQIATILKTSPTVLNGTEKGTDTHVYSSKAKLSMSSSSTSAGRAASAPSLHRNHRIASARVLPPLRRRPHRQERLCPRPAALFVPWLHMHLQRADGHAAEWAASAGQMAGAHPGAQPRPEHSPGGRAAGGGLEHGVSLASPLPAAAQSAPGQRIARHCRGR